MSHLPEIFGLTSVEQTLVMSILYLSMSFLCQVVKELNMDWGELTKIKWYPQLLGGFSLFLPFHYWRESILEGKTINQSINTFPQ